jgi:hypothetical protein
MPSHNVATIRNIVAGWKLGITKVVVEKNGVWHTNLVAPNTLLGAWVPKVEPNNLMVVTNFLLRLDVSIEVRTVSFNMKDYGKQT